jgi:hypothetical protein
MATASARAQRAGSQQGTSAQAVTGARGSRALAAILFLVIVVLALAELWMIAVTLDRPAPDQWGFRGFELALTLSFGSVGALIAARRPENRIGWMALGLSVVGGVQGLVDQYPILADAVSPPLPAADAARWVAAWIWVIPSVGLMTLLPLLFPTGRLLSPRWRGAIVLAGAAAVLQIGSIVLATRPFGPIPPTANPTPYFDQLGGRMAVGYLVQLAAVLVAAASAVARYRRAHGDERLQMKWLAYAAFFLPFAAAAAFSGLPFGPVALIAAGLFAAAAVVLAILRYRLYEIDVIINRTLVYGALSAVLAGIYTASITLSQRAFIAVTGDRSDAPIVLTTLIVVSLFTPLKSRLQAIVDRRVKASGPGGTAPAGPSLAGSIAAVDVLAKLVALRDSGALTTAEFETAKAGLLSQIPER